LDSYGWVITLAAGWLGPFGRPLVVAVPLLQGSHTARQTGYILVDNKPGFSNHCLALLVQVKAKCEYGSG